MPSAVARLDEWLARLETFSPAEIDLGLERVERLLLRLDLDLPATVFTIGGTNGKGSTVAMLDAILRRTDVRVGSYTSPHIMRYNERIRVDGREAADAEIVAAFERIEAVRGDVPLTYFEYGTLAALVVFAERGAGIAILEVGMGGRLDAVNAVEPTAVLITNIALDHCEWLGANIERIAIEKAGIMRADKPAVFATVDIPPAVVRAAIATSAGLIVAGKDYRWTADDDQWSWTGATARLEGLQRPALRGDIQLQNAAGVLALLEASGFADVLQRDIIDAALAEVRLPGRLQEVSRGGSWLLDVAHNPAAAEALAATLRAVSGDERLVTMIGALDDKDVEGVVTALDARVAGWIAVTAESPRAITANELSRRIANTTDRACLAIESVAAGLQQARRRAGPGTHVLVTGSFYVVAPALAALELYSPR